MLGESLYVKSLKIGESIVTDYESGFFVHPNKQVRLSSVQFGIHYIAISHRFFICLFVFSQVEEVCNQLSNDPKLKNGYNAIGFSQGGQFL